jgi:hypothetical protein
VARHIHPETGSPYRLRRSARLDVEARDLTRHEQLTAFGLVSGGRPALPGPDGPGAGRRAVPVDRPRPGHRRPDRHALPGLPPARHAAAPRSVAPLALRREGVRRGQDQAPGEPYGTMSDRQRRAGGVGPGRRAGVRRRQSAPGRATRPGRPTGGRGGVPHPSAGGTAVPHAVEPGHVPGLRGRDGRRHPWSRPRQHLRLRGGPTRPGGTPNSCHMCRIDRRRQ